MPNDKWLSAVQAQTYGGYQLLGAHRSGFEVVATRDSKWG